jgi:hypothetical protein
MSTQFAIKRWSMGKVIIHANILCSDVICFQPPCWVFDKGLKAKRNLQLPKKKYYNNNAIEKKQGEFTLLFNKADNEEKTRCK